MISSPEQAKGANPDYSLWVTASAGSGKTKVLVDRIMALLYRGVPLNHIVCLTFTTAAAFEMRERLMKRLQADQSPQAHGQNHGQNQAQAQAIYNTLLEYPEHLKITTIHGFCVTLLSQFPLEAGLHPFFTVLEDHQTTQMIKMALERVLLSPLDDETTKALTTICMAMGDVTFKECLSTIFQQWHKLFHLHRIYQTAGDYEQMLHTLFIPADTPPPESAPLTDIIAALLASENAVDQALGTALQQQDYDCLLTKTLSPRKRLASAAFKKQHPAMVALLEKLGLHHSQQTITLKIHQWITENSALFQLLRHILQEFSAMKEARNALDYHDLILYTLQLLSDDQHASVLERLDYQIEHILVDEAQDNSPEQWALISLLVDMFITHPTRSLFVVGDKKQSIYGFQGAAPALFDTLADRLQSLLHHRGIDLQRLSFNTSYRSLPCILDTVDQTLQHTFQSAPHIPVRQGLGVVTFSNITQLDTDAPDVPPEESVTAAPEALLEENHSWIRPPLALSSEETKETKEALLSQTIISHITQLLDSKWIIPSTQNPITPDDILILVRNRTKVAPHIIKGLTQHHIPNLGMDRIHLSSRQFIQDILALFRFLALPFDDWSLVHLLKSPLCPKPLSEDDIFTLCQHKRPLMTALQHQENYIWLKKWLSYVDYTPPYELLHVIVAPMLDTYSALLGPDVGLLYEAFSERILTLQENFHTLSELVAALGKSLPVVKKDPLYAKGVRLMTIHGAKGLEAPYVILVDENHRPPNDSVLWADYEGHPLLCLRPCFQYESFHALKEQLKTAYTAENNRLLYVALTRARDGLWVVGSGAWLTALAENRGNKRCQT